MIVPRRKRGWGSEWVLMLTRMDSIFDAVVWGEGVEDCVDVVSVWRT